MIVIWGFMMTNNLDNRNSIRDSARRLKELNE